MMYAKEQILIFLPIIALFSTVALKKYPTLANKIILLLASGFLLIAIKAISGPTITSLSFFNLGVGINAGFVFDKMSTLFLLLLGGLWLLTSLYASRYFAINNAIDNSENNHGYQFNVLLAALVQCSMLIMVSKNLISVVIFYQALAFVLYIFCRSFVHKSDTKSANYLAGSLFIGAIFLFLAAVASYKILGTTDFMDVVKNYDLDSWSFAGLLTLYLLAIAVIAVLPIYWLYIDLYHLSPVLIVTIIVGGMGLNNLVILFKIINHLFVAKTFSFYVDQINQQYFLTAVLLANLFLSAGLAIFSKNLKKILTYLFFNQFIWVVSLFLIFRLNTNQMAVVLLSFVLSQALIFFCISNISLYLSQAQEKTLNGIAYKLRITVILLAFALLNIVGLVPAIGLVEKYLIIKQIIIRNHALINGLIFLVNVALNIICIVKILYPMIEISSKNNNPKSYEVAKEIEYDLSLILPILLLFLTMVLLIYPSFITHLK